MRSRFILGTVIAALLVVEGCTDYQAVQSVRRPEEPNAAIEANILKLQEAKQKLSADPTDRAALSVILTLIKDPNGINRSNAANASSKHPG